MDASALSDQIIQYHQAGRVAEAQALYVKQLNSDPTAFSRYAEALYAAGKVPEAFKAYRVQAALSPNDHRPLAAMATILALIGDPPATEDFARRAIALCPTAFDAHFQLGRALALQGRVGEAIVAMRESARLRPDQAEIFDLLLYTLHFSPTLDAAAILAEHRAWARRFAEPLLPRPPKFEYDCTPDRRLRIGYVSSNFFRHVVGRNILTVLRHHDRTRFETFCYCSNERRDDLTPQFIAAADHWRDITLLSDDAAAQRIREDRIDVLIDLANHMLENRLLLMARKPAPVQVSHMAYPATTGLAAIEYRIADPHLDPPGESEQHNAEQLARLPDCWWCYTPEADEPPVNALPAAQRGYVTFGQLNNLLKLNAVSVALWSRVLHSTPGSRFALLTGRGADAHRYIRSCFASHGIGADRLEVVRPALAQRYLQSYQSIDIGLDPIPYNGHMTSLDACWMGVPVVTLRGNTSVGRAGVSINLNLSLPELTASTADEYVQIASGLARDLPRLATLRATLRERMKRSPIMDAPRYTRALEVLYHNMWDRFCAQSTAG